LRIYIVQIRRLKETSLKKTTLHKI
jgi:hypothetical protein